MIQPPRVVNKFSPEQENAYGHLFYLHLFLLKAILAISYGTKKESKSISGAAAGYY